MNQRKPTKQQWYSLGLAVLLCMACLVISTGTAYGRYRKERETQVTFVVRESQQIALGTFRAPTQEDGTQTDAQADTEVFVPADTLGWETVNGSSQLTFTVANGTSETAFSQMDQRITIRIIGTLGLWTGMETVKLHLQIPSAADPGTTETIQAAVTPIAEGTALYHTHGPGWVYSFLNAEEEELFWTLPGGEFSYVTLTISMDGEAPQEDAALQPQVIAEVIAE